MSSESRNERACRKEVKDKIKQRNEEQRARAEAAKMQKEARLLQTDVEEMLADREQMVMDAVEMRKTDPEGAKSIMARGADIDERIKLAKRAIYMYRNGYTNAKVIALTNRSLSLLAKLNDSEVVFKSQKQLDKLRRDVIRHRIMLDKQNQANREEIDIYLNECDAISANSAFEQDVLAAERMAQIDDIDN